MGLFDNIFNKKKSPEEELVDELVGSGFLSSKNLQHVLADYSLQNELQKIVKKAWKNGASLNEIQKIYDENLLRFKDSPENKEMERVRSNNNAIYEHYDPAKVEELGETAIPESIKEFLYKIQLNPLHVINLSLDYENVVMVKENFRGLLSFTAMVYMLESDELTKSYIGDFGNIVYNRHNYSKHNPRLRGAVQIKGSAFTIFFTKKLSEEDLPNLIKKDLLMGQNDKAMIYNILNNTLYGKNGVHMNSFKKIIEEWGTIENCDNKAYFKVKIL